MASINATDMLMVWEEGLDQPPLQRALLLLLIAYPEHSLGELAELPIGERDRRLLQLRQRCFGAQLQNSAVCPQCREQLEWENSVDDYCIAAHEGGKGDLLAQQGEHRLHHRHYLVHWRLPNSRDIAETLHSLDPQCALLERCIHSAELKGKSIAFRRLPDEVLHALGEQMAAADPLAEINIELHCPACAHQWRVLFDISHFLWQEIHNWAQNMLHSVHRLAQGYGWAERDILALSPLRRQLYLGMLEPSL